MTKTFKNAMECAEYFVKEQDISKYPKELRRIYYKSPIHYLHRDMFDKYVRGKSVKACECIEFQQAEKNAIDFIYKFLINNGYTLSILYKCECTYADGYTTEYAVGFKSIPQQLSLF